MSENRATERLKYCNMEEKVLLKRSRTQEEAEDVDSPGTERQDVQAGPSSDSPVNPGVVGLSSSSCSSGEGSVNKKFDVFISHRGPDTKCSLAYPIYFLLQERGVEAFLDREELQSGERFPEGIEKAIADSKVDVCVLSSGFTESQWCLKELVMMLHKFQMGKSTLVPIFYDVKPTAVKHLTGDFGHGFENLQSKGKYSSKDIDQWRGALYKIGEISGYEGKGELCRIIVNKICELLHVGSMATPRKVLGREKQLLNIICNIMECRENGLGVTSVEISGIGGMGKTTFAKELYNKIFHEFEKSCFIEDVNGLVEKHGVHKVHKQLLKRLFGQDSSSFRMEGREHLTKKLHNAEILVVLDNIHSKIPLSKVFIEDDVSLSRRSVIIVTSREDGVLKHDLEVKEYCKNLISLRIKPLDFNTSKQIFCHHAFGGIDNMQNELNELIEKMVLKCDGLPLALTLLGRHVYNKKINFWENLFNFMKDSLHSEVKDKLKFSYDNLGTELEKHLFLDVATFFRGEKESLLVQLWQRNEEDGKSIQYALDMLKSNLLINVSAGVLEMHDVLVDLGRSIVKDEDSCPGHRSRVWYPSDVRFMLSNELGTKKVKALSLVSQGSAILDEDQCPWSADVFNKLSSLEILILHGHCIEGDFSKLSNRLLWLRWTNFPYQEIPLKLCIKHLRVLQLVGENLIRLWKHPPQEAPSKLRELIVRHCIKLERLPEAIGRLRHLSSINLHKCKSLKFIPESFGQLQRLKDLRLGGCHALERLPETLGDLTSLRSLDMSECFAVVSLPESIGKLQQLSSIYLVKCTSFKIIPDSFGQLQGLRDLKVLDCGALKQLPETFGDLRSLISLKMGGCRAFKIIPHSFGQLKSLKYLQVWNCRALKQLPESFGNLISLSSLRMEKCDAMVSLPESFGKLLQLKDLQITCCNGLERLPQSFECLTSLSRLYVLDCSKIRFSPEQFQWPQLGVIWLSSTNLDDDMEVADSWFVQIGNREQQNFDFWKKYSIWHSQVPQQHNLKWLLHEVAQDIQMKQKGYLDSNNNNNDTGASQASLEFLGIHFMESASNMTFPNKVTVLSLNGFWNLQRLPQLVCNNRYMTYIELCHCYSLQKLPESLGSLSCLEHLCLGWCCNLQELPDTIGNLPNLRALEVVGCLALKRFPSQLRNLSCLKLLCVKHCWIVEAIDIQGLFNLRDLTVSGCVNLKSIVGISDLGELNKLQIEDCMNLKSIVGLSNICKLETLVIQGLISLRHMPLPVGGFASFNFLSSLTIDGCYQLQFSEDHTLVLKGAERINAKTSPLFFATVKERVRHVLLSGSSSDKPFSFFIHELAHHAHVPSLPFIPHAMAVCYVSSVYADDFPDHIPLPVTDFQFPRICTANFGLGNFRCFDFGEEIHVDVRCFTKFNFIQDIQRGDFDMKVHVSKDIRCHFDSVSYPSSFDRVSYPSYEASVKERCIIFLDGGGRRQSKLLASEIFKIFHSELIKQRLVSQAWTQLPSQLRIHDFSALDIAGCQITKISRHCNTCIMEEETGLIWKIRRCIFMDDHSLLLQQPKNSKHSFLAYPGVDHGLEAAVANLYEMSISILAKGNVVHSRKLQQISPKTEEEIPSPLNTLLQSRGFHSTSETMHRLNLFMLKYLKKKSISIKFGIK